MKARTEKKAAHGGVSTGIVALILTILGAVLYARSHSTGYYTFGEMNSTLIVGLIGLTLLIELLSPIFWKIKPDALFTSLLPFLITGLLAGAAMLIVGDRVEGIGNCIVTDYDSGHGGEEAIYLSLIGAVCLLTAMGYCIAGAFSPSGSAPAGRRKTLIVSISGAALGLAALVATVMLVGNPLAGRGSGPVVPGPGAAEAAIRGSYSVSFCQGNGNVDEDAMPDYQFLSANMRGLAKSDGRFYVDITLELDGQGGYSLTSEAYVLEAGKRAEVGDPSGLGLVYRTASEGTYTDNGDGTVTTSPASHVFFELQTDTYSEQMKQMMQIDLGGSDADGSYDSSDYPVLLDYVPETVWTLGENGTVLRYGLSSLKGVFFLSFNQSNGNADEDAMPDYQFLSANMRGLAKSDGRFYVDITLELDGQGGYSLTSEAYVLEAGKRAEVGDPSGLGLVYRTTSEGTYTDNGDGTVTTSPASHVFFELQTDTYSEQMKQMMQIDLGGSDADGSYDSSDYPVLLDYVPETVWTLDAAGGVVLSYAGTESEEEEPGEEEAEAAPPEEQDAALTFDSDDGATTLRFLADGSYVFVFPAYGIEDAGTWSYAEGKLTLTNANGDTAEAEGDPLLLHYVSAVSDQLAGDFTIAADALVFESGEVPFAEVGSDDGATTLRFLTDGSYVFVFPAYGIEDAGTWSYAEGKLTLTNANGDTAEAEGDPLLLHYVSAVSDQLAGDFTIAADALVFESGEVPIAEVGSDDGATTLRFLADGSYVFVFPAYGIEDAGTWSYAEGKLTLTNANGDTAEAEGDPILLHYVSAVSDQLAGDFTISAAELPLA